MDIEKVKVIERDDTSLVLKFRFKKDRELFYKLVKNKNNMVIAYE